MSFALKLKGINSFQRNVKRLDELLTDLKALNKARLAHLDSNVNKQFKSEGAHFGNKWDSLKTETVKRRRKGSSRILQDTRKMANERKLTATKNAAILEFKQIYAATHHYGDRSRGIPERPILPKPEKWAKEDMKIIKAWFKNAVKKAGRFIFK